LLAAQALAEQAAHDGAGHVAAADKADFGVRKSHEEGGFMGEQAFIERAGMTELSLFRYLETHGALTCRAKKAKFSGFSFKILQKDVAAPHFFRHNGGLRFAKGVSICPI
jgi:hypothetical protein